MDKYKYIYLMNSLFLNTHKKAMYHIVKIYVVSIYVYILKIHTQTI